MLKKQIFVSILIMLTGECFGQNREDVWELGYSSFADTMHFKFGISFNNGNASTFTTDRTIGFFDTETGICDTSGSLQFYFNGILLGNRFNQRMHNSDSINPGPLNGNDWLDLGGTGILEGAITIPRPTNRSQYYIFYQNVDLFDNGYLCHDVRYSLIDMNLGTDSGSVVSGQKMKSILNDTLDQGAIAACKHANGRDWWIVVRKYPTSKYYTILVTSDSMKVSYQSIGSSFTLPDYARWASFSPDGSKYAFLMSNFSNNDSIEIMDFDRCTGKFSNPVIWRLPNTYGISCLFSPNSRFLYAIQQENLYQYDTYAPNVPNSLVKVDTFDGTIDPLSGIPAWFAQSQLAPDGKIYIGTWGSYKALAVINSPDSLGKACNFTQHSFALPYYNFCTPYYPNYDLGALSESGCDTLTSISNNLDNWQFRVFPNPVRQWLNIEYQSQENLRCQLFDITGRAIANFTLYPYFRSRMFDMS